jgi:hypothetical protein
MSEDCGKFIQNQSQKLSLKILNIFLFFSNFKPVFFRTSSLFPTLHALWKGPTGFGWANVWLGHLVHLLDGHCPIPPIHIEFCANFPSILCSIRPPNICKFENTNATGRLIAQNMENVVDGRDGPTNCPIDELTFHRPCRQNHPPMGMWHSVNSGIVEECIFLEFHRIFGRPAKQEFFKY